MPRGRGTSAQPVRTPVTHSQTLLTRVLKSSNLVHLLNPGVNDDAEGTRDQAQGVRLFLKLPSHDQAREAFEHLCI
jgi:hypothetical protein